MIMEHRKKSERGGQEMSSLCSFEKKRGLNMSRSSENIQTPLSGAERFG